MSLVDRAVRVFDDEIERMTGWFDALRSGRLALGSPEATEARIHDLERRIAELKMIMDRANAA
jgi:hypothetical protein